MVIEEGKTCIWRASAVSHSDNLWINKGLNFLILKAKRNAMSLPASCNNHIKGSENGLGSYSKMQNVHGVHI